MRGGNAGRSGEWGACEWLGWDASSPAVQRITAPSLALKYAKADADGVTVRRVKLGPRVRSVVISNSYGGQIGRHNRQLNDFRYRIVQPRVSVAAMLAASPALQRALARLVANPDSAIANYAFRQRLSAPVGPTGGVRFTGMPSPSGARVSVHLDDRGEVVVDRARGLQIGNWNTQREPVRLPGQPARTWPGLRPARPPRPGPVAGHGREVPRQRGGTTIVYEPARGQLRAVQLARAPSARRPPLGRAGRQGCGRLSAGVGRQPGG